MSGGQFVARAGDQIQRLGKDYTNRLVTADQAIYSLVESLMSLARDKLADVNTDLLSKLALKTKEFENKNAEINRLSAAREEELQSTIDRNSRVFKLTEELSAFKKETIKRESSIADAERNKKSELVEYANQITMLKSSIADAERCHKSELVESSNQIATLKTELDNQKQNVAELENTLANSVNLEKENKSLKIKVRWLEVFLQILS